MKSHWIPKTTPCTRFQSILTTVQKEELIIINEHFLQTEKLRLGEIWSDPPTVAQLANWRPKVQPRAVCYHTACTHHKAKGRGNREVPSSEAETPCSSLAGNTKEVILNGSMKELRETYKRTSWEAGWVKMQMTSFHSQRALCQKCSEQCWRVAEREYGLHRGSLSTHHHWSLPCLRLFTYVG